jgi:hypothetical protein
MAEAKINLEAGKTYVCRDGSTVRVLDVELGRGTYCATTDRAPGQTCVNHLYTLDGRHNTGIFYHALDIVIELREALELIERAAMPPCGSYPTLLEALQELVAPARAHTPVPALEARNREVLALAAAAGKQVQYRCLGGNWIDSWSPAPEEPSFEYRIKPEPVKMYLGAGKSPATARSLIRLGEPGSTRDNAEMYFYDKFADLPDNVIVLDLDPDTLAVIDCVSEEARSGGTPQ